MSGPRATKAELASRIAELEATVKSQHGGLAEALEQQTATAEILRLIGTSPMDTQPVFDGIARSGVRVCGAQSCTLFVVDGDTVRVAATHGVPAERVERFRSQFPVLLSAENQVSQVLRERRIFHLADIEHNPAATPRNIENARLGGYRTRLMVPMLRGDSVLGLISVTHQAPTPFPEQQVALLQTFADQAVIAIENVRLFTELEARNRDLTEALEQQTATGEILRVISSSQTDTQPVFDAIAHSAVKLCDATFGVVFRFDGEMIHLVAHNNPSPQALDALYRIWPMRPDSGSLVGRAILDRAVLHLHDVAADPSFTYAAAARHATDIRTYVGVPMLRDGQPIGVISLYRQEVAPFSDKQIELVKTFADQAVIAIENVRLFTELQQKNEALTQAHAQVTEALDRQTATSEILKAISSSPTDVRPVFDRVVRSAVHLCGRSGSTYCVVFRVEGERLHIAAHHGASDAGLEELQRRYPATLSAPYNSLRSVRERAVIQLTDADTDPTLTEGQRRVAQIEGFRSQLFVPMLQEDRCVGVIALTRPENEPFPDTQVELLKTFAAQAVIAIENVRLFTELQARTSDLTRSVDELTALGEVSRAVSSTLELETVLQTIVTRANQLAGTAGCTIWEYDEGREEFRLRVSHYADESDAEILRSLGRVTTIRKGQGVTSQVVELRQPVQVADIAAAGAYESPIRKPLLDAGHRALLGVPLLLEEEVIGVLAVTRKTPGEFAPEIVRLLTTFATQSALAIQNARLFREIEDKGRQLEAASRHKSEFLASMSHELRTPLNAVIGFSEVLLERMFGEVNEKQTEYLQDILSSGRHLLSLINDMLDLSKIEAGRMELALAPFHVPEAIENAVTLVKERAARHGIALHVDVDPRLGELVGDERKIKQVLLNLLSNAVKFTPDRGRIGVKAVLADGLIEISISDTGIGIAPEDQKAIFEEFRQVGSDDTRKHEGTGLGLTLTQKFVEMHGGRIRVESEMGRGSTFTFTLPIRP